MEKIKFYSLLNTPKTKPSSTGEKIYTWEYFDRAGNLKTDKSNVYEKIQSYKEQVDYKKLIEKGDLDIYDDRNDLYLDTTKLPNNYADTNEYIKSISVAIAEKLKAFTVDKEVAKVSQESGQIVHESGQNVATNSSIEGGKN